MVYNGPYEVFTEKRRPVDAAISAFRLVYNKEDTSKVFRVIAALDGPALEMGFKRFASTPYGQHLLAERTCLRETLMRHDWLASLPEGSLGRAYYDFMAAEGLTADGFQEEMNRTGETFEAAGPERRYFLYRMRHAHDLIHVLTGYGRDAIGELSILQFTANLGANKMPKGKLHNAGVKLIVLTGWLKARRMYARFSMDRCLAEAKELGANAKSLFLAPWEDLLPQPLEAVRATYRIGRPDFYLSMKSALADFDVMRRAQLAAKAHKKTQTAEAA
ncbi:putative uncharacterized protein [Parvularcula bermudensis HTCC2503]|uniref:Ubiquinone biosynthesis protein COQ4 n=1 Tax=Parvularcula bermudensis (strain ATCC BAA-594 / HTCC2503 / KCTC 12087) TaxID=314260 RepID=E0TBL0_PARBH|nr:Coq4 family protein [Parvularcula bermudensis]ADM08385.1 putative uncharacterized protein [Parvularcula bermudensis HTCC2503]